LAFSSVARMPNKKSITSALIKSCNHGFGLLFDHSFLA
jgi:hypothetical protein